MRRRGQRVSVALVLADAAACVASIGCALALRFAGDVPQIHYAPYALFLFVLIPWRLAVCHAFGLYDFRRRLTLEDHFAGALGAAVVSVAGGYLAMVFARAYYPPYVMALSRAVALLDCVLLAVWLVGSRAYVLARLFRGGYRIRVLVAGNEATRLHVADELRRHAPRLLAVEGAVDLDTAADLDRCIAAGEVDQVVATQLPDSQTRLRDFLACCDRHGVELFLYPELDLSLIAGARLTTLAGLSLIALQPAHFSTPYRAGKRAMDIAVSASMLVLMLPVAVAVAIAIWLDSRGAILYSQPRVGLGGQVFRLYKFRTMVAGAEMDSGPVLASNGDPRITRVGRFLRKTRLDEVPQFWHILTGKMSLVGPRPERPEFVERFIGENPLYERRQCLRPGLTGLAQIHARYDSDYAHKLRYDLIYLNSVSFGMDLRILFATVGTVLTGRGAT